MARPPRVVVWEMRAKATWRALGGVTSLAKGSWELLLGRRGAGWGWWVEGQWSGLAARQRVTSPNPRGLYPANPPKPPVARFPI